MPRRAGWLAVSLFLVAAAPGDPKQPSLGEVDVIALPTGGAITPTATPGSTFLPLVPGLASDPSLPAGMAEAQALSPDGKTLLVLCSGYNFVTDADANLIPEDSTEFVFVFDVSGKAPVQRQVLKVHNSYVGIAFAPHGEAFYVAGGVDDDVKVFTRSGGTWSEGAPIPLGHGAIVGLSTPSNPIFPVAASLALTADGTRAVVANRFNDSISIVDLAAGALLAELDLRPGKSGGAPGVPGGEYPTGVAVLGNRKAYVTSGRDREVVVVDIARAPPSVLRRIPVQGNPSQLVLDRAGSRLFVASDAADVVSVVDTRTDAVVAAVGTLAPEQVLTPAQARYKGASPTALALSPDEETLYVANRGTSSLAVVALGGHRPEVKGLIPTGFYPSDVKVSRDGRTLYVSNMKYGVVGPNRGCYGSAWGTTCQLAGNTLPFIPNQYVLNHLGSALLAMPAPDDEHLALLTAQVARNNGFGSAPSAAQAQLMARLRSKIEHVIYIVKENRTYDQVLGDLSQGNGDPTLTEFGLATTPSQHALARSFVNLDNFYAPGDVSGNGWPLSTAGREPDSGAREMPLAYAGNGGSYDWEGPNRNVDVALAGAARAAAAPWGADLDEDTLPGTGNIASPDGPDGEVQQGYLWHAVLRAGKTFRNYGVFSDQVPYDSGPPEPDNGRWAFTPLDRHPFAHGVLQARAGEVTLAAHTDPWFRGFDDAYPDFWREAEWEREFAGFVARGDLPALTIMDLMNDHTGSYDTAIDGVNTPDLQVADNDYAVGRIVEAVARSRYASNTLIFIVEDDAQDGPDHVDSHRSIAFVVGPYVKQGALVHTHYTTVNMLRTITDVLGLDHLGIFDASVLPMTDVFDLEQPGWSFRARASSLLRSTALPLPKGVPLGPPARPPHDAAWWAARTAGFDFSRPDRLDALAYNRILWEGLIGGRPYRTGRERAGP